MSKTEFEQEFTVSSELGLHARPAGQFVALAGDFPCEVWVCRKGSEEWINGKSILSLLTLAAGQGTVLCIRAVGEKAAEAVQALGCLIENPPAL